MPRPSRLGVEDVAQSVAKQVEAEYDEKDRQAGCEHVPPRIGQEFARFRDHPPPLRRRWLRAEPEKAERGGGEDREPHADRGADDDRRGDVRQHVQQDDAPRGHAEGHRRFDEHLVLQRPGLRVDQTREPRPVGERQGEDHVLDRRPEGLRDRDREHDLRDREEDVGGSHQHVAEPAAVPAGDETQGHADQKRRADRDDRDHQRDRGAEQNPAVDVSAHPVGAEPVGVAGRQQALRRVHLPRSVGMRREPGSENRRDNQQHDDDEPEQRRAVARELVHDVEEALHRPAPLVTRVVPAAVWRTALIRVPRGDR